MSRQGSSFETLYGLWGDGTYLSAGDGSVVRRIEVAARKVTTITRLAGRTLTGIWGDGTHISVTDGRVRRVNLATSLV